jgi:hypothetical protein
VPPGTLAARDPAFHERVSKLIRYRKAVPLVSSADTYRHLGFDPEAPMRALREARAMMNSAELEK